MLKQKKRHLRTACRIAPFKTLIGKCPYNSETYYTNKT